MIKYKYKIGDTIKTIHGDIAKINDLQISRIDNEDIPSYWCRFSLELHPDNCDRNIWESTILTKVYTTEDALKLKADIEVLSLPKRVYCDSKETLSIIAGKFAECHIGTSINWEELFIQT